MHAKCTIPRQKNSKIFWGGGTAPSRPPSWICYVIISDHPRSLFIGPHWPFKFYANPMYSFEDMTIWNFCRFGLKCLFTPQKFWFLGVWTPKRDWSSSRPHKAPPWPKPHIHANLVQIGHLVRPVRETKKSKKAIKETYSGNLGVRRDHPRWRSDM